MVWFIEIVKVQAECYAQVSVVGEASATAEVGRLGSFGGCYRTYEYYQYIVLQCPILFKGRAPAASPNGVGIRCYAYFRIAIKHGRWMSKTLSAKGETFR